MTDFISDMTEAVAINVNKAILASIAEKPTSPLINLEDATHDQIKAFLRSKRSTTWSLYSIGHEDSLDKAAVWFSRELGLLHAFLYRTEEYLSAFDV